VDSGQCRIIIYVITQSNNLSKNFKRQNNP
jgi:hypothetical protein